MIRNKGERIPLRGLDSLIVCLTDLLIKESQAFDA